MRVITIISLFMLVMIRTTTAQTINYGAIKGRVTAEDGTEVPGVGVRLKDARKQTVTNENGAYVIRNVAPGTYLAEVFVAGHDMISFTVNITAGQTVEQNFQLKASQQTLQEVIIASGKNKFAKKESDYVARMPLKNLENPQVYNIVTSEIIKEQGILEYKDAIKNVAGVNSTETVSNGRTSTIIRGFRTANYIRNGMVANQLITVDMANLERIEVMKGPSGTLFGSGAVSYGGLVNRVTKKPFETFRTDLNFTAGSWGLNRITADINAPLNEDKTALLRVNLGRWGQESFQEAGFRRNYFLATSFAYKASDRLSFLIDVEMFRNAGTQAIAYINPLGAPADYKAAMAKYYKRTFYSNDLESVFPGYNLFATMNYKINSNWNTTTIFSTGGVNARQQYQFSGTLLGTGETLSRRVQKYSHNYNTIQIQQNLNGEFHTGAIKHRVLMGADYLADITQPTYILNYMHDTISTTGTTPILMREDVDRRLAGMKPTNYFKSHTDRYGIYVSDVVNLTDQLLVMASVRWDRVDAKGTYSLATGKTTGNYNKSSFSPKFGAVYQVVKDQLSVFANYQNGFSYSAQVDRNGNVFKPEQANQWEGGIKADLLKSKLSVTLSAYDIAVKDKIRQDNTDLTIYYQDGTWKSKGFEAEVIANPISGLNILAGYGFNDIEITKAKDFVGKRPPASGAKHTANTWISYRINSGKVSGLGIGAGAVYNGDIVFDNNNLTYFPAYTVFNGTIFYDRPGYRVGVKLDNITNEMYWGPWGEPQPPRNWAVNLTIKF
ncbi:TonB-dependent receptor [uncultured Chitinophaga sp.]|uniref:TonB-dependent receptor n=1 Tax=uncultured Chitinophaga sp. TaxID=339340 RepID=UPI0025FDA870|nr:TonB-dependent receptor [uncultured Chitinophaga sp.]